MTFNLNTTNAAPTSVSQVSSTPVVGQTVGSQTVTSLWGPVALTVFVVAGAIFTVSSSAYTGGPWGITLSAPTAAAQQQLATAAGSGGSFGWVTAISSGGDPHPVPAGNTSVPQGASAVAVANFPVTAPVGASAVGVIPVGASAVGVIPPQPPKPTPVPAPPGPPAFTNQSVASF